MPRAIRPAAPIAIVPTTHDRPRHDTLYVVLPVALYNARVTPWLHIVEDVWRALCAAMPYWKPGKIVVVETPEPKAQAHRGGVFWNLHTAEGRGARAVVRAVRTVQIREADAFYALAPHARADMLRALQDDERTPEWLR